MRLDTEKRVFVLGITRNIGRLVMSQLKNITDLRTKQFMLEMLINYPKIKKFNSRGRRYTRY